MSETRLKRLVLGSVSTNCYILYQEDARRALVFDPADDVQRIQTVIEENRLQLEAVLLTHGHFDHILAAEQLCRQSGCLMYAHEAEAIVACDVELNLSAQFGAGCQLKVDQLLKDNQQLELAGFSIRVIHTPGHTKGSACYYFEKEGLLFSGDTLFAGSVGRTDFPTGSSSQLLRSVKDKLLLLPDETKVLPGHGDTSTIGYEKEHNPYML